MTVQDVIAKAVLNGAKIVDKFKGAVRTDELNTLEKNDEFVIPEDYKILEAPVGNSGRTAQYIVVDVNGTPKNFYPSSLTKNLQEVDEKCVPTGQRLHTNGEVCTWFKTQVGVDQAMNKMKGCRIKISDIKPGLVKVYGSVNETQTQNFLTVDWAGDKRPEA